MGAVPEYEMNEATAIQTAQDWVEVRREVRKHLIARARNDNPVVAPVVGKPVTEIPNEIRKLWHFPSDLSEERLLNLIRFEEN